MALAQWINELIGRNNIGTLKVTELKVEEQKLRTKINGIHKDIRNKEGLKKRKFNEGIGKDSITKEMIINDIKTIDLKLKLNLRTYNSANKRLRFISNLIVIKEHEKELKKNPIWSKITRMDVDTVMEELIKIDLAGKPIDNIIDTLNEVIEGNYQTDVAYVDEDERNEILDLWSALESGEILPDEAEKAFSEYNSRE